MLCELPKPYTLKRATSRPGLGSAKPPLPHHYLTTIYQTPRVPRLQVLCELPKPYTLKARDIEAWAESLLEPLTQRERRVRKGEEAAAAERERRRKEQRAEVQVRVFFGGGRGLGVWV